MKQKIIEELNKGMHANRKRHESARDRTCYHPSGLGGCRRSIYYGMMGFKQKPLDDRIIRLFDNGTSAHVRLGNYFRKAGVLIDEEKFVCNDEFNIKGSADAIVEIDGERVLIDFKTIRSYPFKLMKEGKKGLDEKYRVQLNVYMWLLGMKRGYFVFECKDTQEFHIVEVPFEAQLIENIKGKIRLIDDCIKEGVPPLKDYSETDWQCKYCGYNSICYPEKAEGVQ